MKTLIFTYVKQPNTDQEKCFQVIILPNSNPEQNGTEHNEGGENNIYHDNKNEARELTIQSSEEMREN